MSAWPSPPTYALAVASAAAFAVLLLGSAVTWRLGRRCPGRDYTNLRLRMRTWWVIVPVLSAVLLIGPWAVALLFAAISTLALREYFFLAAPAQAQFPILMRAAAYVLVPCQYFLTSFGELPEFALFVPTVALLFALTGTNGRWTALGAGLAVFCLSHVARIAGTEQGVAWLAFLLVITQLNDVAQYVWGKRFGRTPLAPALSPNKTREGLYGGLATTAVFSALLGPVFLPLDCLQSIVSGIVLGLAGVAGDLTISALKRRAGVKDAGNALPGHGGVLDRVDSLIYAAPLLFYVLCMDR